MASVVSMLEDGFERLLAGKNDVKVLVKVSGYRIDKLRNRRPKWFREDFLVLLELLRRGEVHPAVAERLPLTEVRRAHELLESSAATGKLVLVP